MSTSDIVGIDLGTTFSLAAQCVDGEPRVIRDSAGLAQVPSVLSFAEDGTVLVGTEARKQALADPDHTVYSVKRLMGRTLAELEGELNLVPYQVTEREERGGRKVLHVRIGEREHTPEELSALILKEVRQRAGGPTKAVITVPAYFDDTQRQATRDAGRIAGLDVLRILNEPTAAALAYGLDRKGTSHVVVYDLGGGTFDCSVLTLADGVFKVLSTNGDTFLGGDDFDREVVKQALADLNIDSPDPELLQHLRDRAEATKVALSSQESAEFKLSLPARSVDYSRTFTRGEFESLITPYIERTLKKCRAAIRDADLEVGDIAEVVLVGGSTRIPLVRQQVGEFFGREPHAGLNPDEVVALGAAVQADILAGNRKGTLLLDVVPLSLGIETQGGVVDKVVHRNSPIPSRETRQYSTQKDGQTAVKINIYQGERELTKDCRPLGEFTLSGIPPMPALAPQVDVTFLVDADGILTVSARENRSGREATVTVQAGHGLSQDEVDRLVLESVEHAREDYKARRLIELRAKAEGDLGHAEKGLSQAGSELTAGQRAAIETSRDALKQAAAGDDVDELQARLDEFAKITVPLAELLMSRVIQQRYGGRRPEEMGSDV